LAAEYLFNTLSGLQATHIPFQGGAQAITSVISGQVEVLSISLPPASPFIKNGTLKALAVSSLKRVDTLPNIKTVGESGYSDFEERSWVGFFVPANTPAAIVNRLNAEISQVVALPEVRERLVALGMEPQISSAAEFNDYVRKEVNMWSKIISTTGITLD
jgi:tripartite-type tricarboxylate transporter receptor subunit TctC